MPKSPKPCPFCGSDSTIVDFSTNESGKLVCWVKCEDCHARGPQESFAPDAICRWYGLHERLDKGVLIDMADYVTRSNMDKFVITVMVTLATHAELLSQLGVTEEQFDEAKQLSEAAVKAELK